MLTLGGLSIAEDFSPQVKMTILDNFVGQKTIFRDSSCILGLSDVDATISYDFGVSWNNVAEFKDYEPLFLERDPYYPQRAFVFMSGTQHFFTTDEGKTWQKFQIQPTPIGLWDSVDVSFNAVQKDLIILNIDRSPNPSSSLGAEKKVYYTKDGFRTDAKLVELDVDTCVFARSTPDFDSSVSPETIICTLKTMPKHPAGEGGQSNLIKTTDFFSSFEYIQHESLKDSETISLQVESAFIVVILSNSSVLVSKDAANFQKAEIDCDDGGISVLKSTPLSLRLSLTWRPPHFEHEKAALISDPTGLKFTRSEKKDPFSQSVSHNGVTFENFRVSEREHVTKYSVDDGRTWKSLEIIHDNFCKVEEGCSLHFDGRWPTLIQPGLLIASGINGKVYSKDYSGVYNQLSDENTYISRDGGASWKFAFSCASRVTRADQGNIIVAIPIPGYEDPVNQFHYSLDHGNSWLTYDLPEPLAALSVSTISNMPGTKIVISAQYKMTPKYIVYSVDFKGALRDVDTCAKAGGIEQMRGHKEQLFQMPNGQCLLKRTSGNYEQA